MSKRVFGILISLVMVMMVFAGNTAFAAGGVEISEFTANGGNDIYEGNRFTLTLKIKNDSGQDITNVGVSFGAGASFQPYEGGRDRSYAPEIINGAQIQGDPFEMFYTGGDDKNLPITITYTDSNGDRQSVNTSIYIRNAVQEEKIDDNTPPPDTSKSKPVLQLEAGDIPEGKAGGMVTLPITLKNTSSYEARDIKITPMFNAENNPFTIEQMLLYGTIDKIPSQKTGNVSFQLKIDKLAAAKTYSLPVKIEYTNAYKDPFTEEKILYIRITNTNLPPQLVVRDAKSSLQEVLEEQKFSVTFDIWNMGTLEAENVTIDLEKNDYFYFLDNMTKQYLFEIKGLQSKQITYNFKAKKDIASGTYGITMLLQHNGSEGPERYTVYVTAVGKEEEKEEVKKDDINIITDNVTTPDGVVQVEQPFTVSFSVKNTGTTVAKAVKVTIDGGDKILPKSLNVLNLTDINPGESVPVAFSFVPTKDCDSRTYAIKASIEYKNNNEPIQKDQYMGVLIQNPEKDKEKEKEQEKEEDTSRNTVPKIIISEYSTDPVMVSAGENFTLRMKFLNTNQEKAVENMKITLVVNEGSEKTGSVFSPVQSSNTFYIARMDPGETAVKEMMMYTIPDAQAKTYVVKASFEYEYEEKDQLKTNTMDDLFGIPVVQPAKLETSDVFVSEPALVGQPVYLSSEFYNMGKVTLSNLMVKVEGDFDTKESNYFVGNFEMGMSDFYEAPVTPLVPGETKGLLVFTFEDSAGKEHRIEKEFTVNAMDSAPVMNPDFPMDPNFPMDPGMMDPGMEGMKGPRLPIIPIAIGAGVVILFIVFMIIRKRRKKKKEMMLDEDI